MMRRLLLINSLLLVPVAVWGQKERADIRQGNRAYYEGKYPEAEVGYKRAIEKNINSYEANFNLAGALYKQGRYDDAAATYGKLAQDGTDAQRQASTYYNMGNTYVKQRKLDEAIEAYKNALRLVPEDKEAKFNLAYAKKLKQEEEKKNKDNQDNQNQNQNQDQNGGGG
ncbi:MAG: tetratricopeptide repeat protein [Rikenellaceae bacterium]|nr:tetratricopeptide repeat protein [Rikenellaceae bacterium]